MQSIKLCITPSLTDWSDRPTLIPEVWSNEILGYYYTDARRTVPRMITQEKLLLLVDESADIPQLDDLNAALVELAWRRKEQKTMETIIKDLNATMVTMSANYMLLAQCPTFWQWCRNKLAQLYIKWA